MEKGYVLANEKGEVILTNFTKGEMLCRRIEIGKEFNTESGVVKAAKTEQAAISMGVFSCKFHCRLFEIEFERDVTENQSIWVTAGIRTTHFTPVKELDVAETVKRLGSKLDSNDGRLLKDYIMFPENVKNGDLQEIMMSLTRIGRIDFTQMLELIDKNWDDRLTEMEDMAKRNGSVYLNVMLAVFLVKDKKGKHLERIIKTMKKKAPITLSSELGEAIEYFGSKKDAEKLLMIMEKTPQHSLSISKATATVMNANSVEALMALCKMAEDAEELYKVALWIPKCLGCVKNRKFANAVIDIMAQNIKYYNNAATAQEIMKFTHKLDKELVTVCRTGFAPDTPHAFLGKVYQGTEDDDVRRELVKKYPELFLNKFMAKVKSSNYSRSDVDALIAVLQSENVNVEIKKTVAKKAISLEKSSEVKAVASLYL